VDPKNPDPIWVITDGSKSWIGAVYRQGPEWQICRQAGFLSKKFSVAQQHYRTHEHETMAVLKAFMKWEDKLLGRKLTLVTDHKGLEYFETKRICQTDRFAGGSSSPVSISPSSMLMASTTKLPTVCLAIMRTTRVTKATRNTST
jgi:RNase H-like domain found in reverse transcriptase